MEYMNLWKILIIADKIWEQKYLSSHSLFFFSDSFWDNYFENKS